MHMASLLCSVACTLLRLRHLLSASLTPCCCCPLQIRESDIGTRAGLFEVVKVGDEFFTFIVDCKVSNLLHQPLSYQV
jgi:hypothetical protein